MSDITTDSKHNLSDSPLYSEHLAPVDRSRRTWSLWNLAAIWIGMAVCIPTYLLASYMIKSGLSWQASLAIIGLANLIITVPMVLNGHAGVKYGIPFPVLGRAAFGIHGIHIPSILRALVACGWFGVQTWIGGLAFYAIWHALAGSQASLGLDAGKFIGFGLFWLVNLYFIWKGTESIKWLESFSAPILLVIGVLLIIWGSIEAGGFGTVMRQGKQLEQPTAVLSAQGDALAIQLSPLKATNGAFKADEFRVGLPAHSGRSETPDWQVLDNSSPTFLIARSQAGVQTIQSAEQVVTVQFRKAAGERYIESSVVPVSQSGPADAGTGAGVWWKHLLWLTAMVGFWATMSLSIADITRYARTQKEQVLGQFLGLPGTMVLYSFIGIFVTFAAITNFPDILIAEDAPWDPVSLLARFESPTVVIVSQVFMLIATLSTNIAANVIAPANVFANIFPKRIDFKRGGLITAIIGIVIAPWWLLDEISGILIFVSGLLGPVLGIMLCDYFVLRRKQLNLAALYQTDGEYSYRAGFNPAAMWALAAGMLLALIGYWVPALSFLYNLSWFTGFSIAFVLYYVLQRGGMHRGAG